MNTKLPSFEDSQLEHNKQSNQSRHLGKVIVVTWSDDGQPRHTLGPHYMFFISALMISIVIFGLMGVSLIAASKQEFKAFSMFAIIFSLSFYAYSYVKVGLSNPGFASTSQELADEFKSDQNYCAPCKVIRFKGIVHCYSCDVCVHGYHHHCPWIGKCVARDNKASFKRFLFSIMLVLTLYSVCVYLNNQGHI